MNLDLNLNALDIVILLPLLVGLVMGIIRGFISEIIAIMVVILGVIGSRFGAPSCADWLVKQVSWSQEVCDIVAYVLIFLAIAVSLALLAKLFTKVMKKVHLGWANRLFGGVFGMCKYAIFILIAVFVMDKANHRFHWLDKSKVVKQSVLYPEAVKLANELLYIVRG